jgi:hypothetical protein
MCLPTNDLKNMLMLAPEDCATIVDTIVAAINWSADLGGVPADVALARPPHA